MQKIAALYDEIAKRAAEREDTLRMGRSPRLVRSFYKRIRVNDLLVRLRDELQFDLVREEGDPSELVRADVILRAGLADVPEHRRQIGVTLLQSGFPNTHLDLGRFRIELQRHEIS